MTWDNVFNPDRLRVELQQVRDEITAVATVSLGRACYVKGQPVPRLPALRAREKELKSRIAMADFQRRKLEREKRGVQLPSEDRSRWPTPIPPPRCD